MKSKSKIVFLLIGIFLIFLGFLKFFPVVTFFIVLSLGTVYVVNQLIERCVPEKYKTLVILIFSFTLYLGLALFIGVSYSLTKKLLSENLTSLFTHPYFNWIYKRIKSELSVSVISSSIGEVGGYSIIYPVLTFFMLKEASTLRKGMLSLIPNAYFEMALNLLYHLNKKLKGYFKGLTIQTLIYSGVCTLGSLIFLPKYALALGVIGGLANVIPFLGTIFNYVFFGIVFYLFKGIPGAFIGAGIVSLAQIIDMIVYPLTYARVLSLPSSVIIISVLIWGKFFGILGMILAVPLTTIIYAIVVEFGRTLKYY
ncbi:MAG: AI-2E family transporter [Thermodesulfobacteria bacterium]|nr:AI-2E family transporter [Thermodesulfobacteriota bacterium]